MRRTRQFASTLEVEANGRSRGRSRHIDGVRPRLLGSLDCFGPQGSSHSTSAIRSADVQEHEPRHIALESLFDNGNANELLVVERTQECGATFQNGLEEIEERLDAVRTAALRQPTWDIDIDRATREFTGSNLKEGVDLL